LGQIAVQNKISRKAGLWRAVDAPLLLLMGWPGPCFYPARRRILPGISSTRSTSHVTSINAIYGVTCHRRPLCGAKQTGDSQRPKTDFDPIRTSASAPTISEIVLFENRSQVFELVEKVPDVVAGTLLPVRMQVGKDVHSTRIITVRGLISPATASRNLPSATTRPPCAWTSCAERRE
jgi:hypothetical protein